ncbi:2-oxoglutarate dehydrogenase E1 component, partial [Gammaproteobacteria bacterium]|nr:2-oxoglutarate dehydrogenase E1 component [Gammaproteobacteria bacterium]
MKLKDLISALQIIYCGPVGAEYMYISDSVEVRWVQQRLETIPARPYKLPEQRKRILERLTAAEGLERYLHTKYVGQKRFSLEGGDSLIPALDALIQGSGEQGAKEIVIGMAHRGRLNVLINSLGKAPHVLFDEFEGRYDMSDPLLSAGDVKYHMGFSSDIQTSGGPVHLALAFNPSHLEIISPVVEGSVRARQTRRNDLGEFEQVLPIVIHGDAAFAGQGVVMETLQMSQARGYRTGGTVHIIVNNQIGFTTSNPHDARSTIYCTEVAKMVQAPIFHVNGDDPDAVVFITELALEYRQTFNKDVVIDLVCYRRHGHNEADEPAITQPTMYKKIRSLQTTRDLYSKRLEQDGVIGADESTALVDNYRQSLDDGHVVAGQFVDPHKASKLIDWTRFLGATWEMDAETRISEDKLAELQRRLGESIPDDFSLHARIIKTLAERDKMVANEVPMDWGCAETLAYAALLDDGYHVRLSGQDSGRGTFAHRQAMLHNQDDRRVHIPLQHIRKDHFTVINSLLSEEAVLGFEYGYSTTDPETLVIWEAQFGDFANGAQVVIDQFISSGQDKWGRLSGLVMMLPHGFEGQGPEHSSARLERFLQLCAGHNMQVVVPSTPAQIFHLLRRQMIRPLRAPLIIMSPKSLLRHPLSTSVTQDLTQGEFQNVIGEINDLNPAKVNRVIVCSGKVYFDLLKARDSNSIDNIAIIRLEQIQPFPHQELAAALEPWSEASELVWCQEEPKNQGAWYQTRHHLRSATQKQQKL